MNIVIVDLSTASRTCLSTPIAQELSLSDASNTLRRFQSSDEERPRILHLDSRHTEAAYHLLKELHSLHPHSPRRPLISIDVEKDRPPFLRKLLPLCDIVFTNERFAQLYVSPSSSSSAAQDGELLCLLLGGSGTDPTLDGEDRAGEAMRERLQKLTQLFRQSSAKVVVSTLGAHGSLLVRRRSRHTVNPSPPSTYQISPHNYIFYLLSGRRHQVLETVPSRCWMRCEAAKLPHRNLLPHEMNRI